jgi:cytochrome b561
MQFVNTSSRYGAISQGIHWLTALLVVLLLLSGKVGEIEAKDSNALYYWHSSLGLTVLLLAVARLAWRLVSPPPAFPPAMSSLARRIARAFHILFYALLVALPLSGWFAASSEGGVATFFGIATLPGTVTSQPASSISAHEERRAGEREGADEFWEETHETLGNALLLVAILHVLAALKHHFVDKDDILRRMLPRGRGGGSM